MDGEKAKWTERFARAGLIAKGIVYCLIGGLSAMAAFGLGGEVSGRKDAFTWLLGLPFGRIVIGLVAIGLIGYAVWRFIQAINDPENKGSDTKGVAKRLGYAGSGISYGALAIYAGFLAFQGAGGGNGGGGGSRQLFVSKLLEQPGGQWLVGAVALLLVGIGIYQFYKGFSGKYKNEVNEAGMSEKERETYLKVGRFGYISRGIVLGVIGYLFLRAALQANPSQAQGTEGAFQFLQNSGFGPWLMGIIAIGLFAYGIFCFVKAKYQTIGTE